MARQFPIFIIVRDRVTPLGQLVGWLESIGQSEIWLIDNASTYHRSSGTSRRRPTMWFGSNTTSDTDLPG